MGLIFWARFFSCYAFLDYFDYKKYFDEEHIRDQVTSQQGVKQIKDLLCTLPAGCKI